MIRCPYCAKQFDPLETAHDENLKAILAINPTFGKDAPLVWAYVELFGVVPFRLKARKLRVLTNDMKRLWELGQFAFEKKNYTITRRGIADALHATVLHPFSTHLTNHNYLKKIMIGIAETEGAEAGKKAERDLYDREADLRRRSPIPTDEESQANLRRVGNILKDLR